jgi:hypothetical protein
MTIGFRKTLLVILLVTIVVLLAIWATAFINNQRNITEAPPAPITNDSQFTEHTGTVTRITVSDRNTYSLSIRDTAGEISDFEVIPSTEITETLSYTDEVGSTTLYTREVSASDIALDASVKLLLLDISQSEVPNLITVRFTTEIEEDIQTYLQNYSLNNQLLKGSWTNSDPESGTFSLLQEDPSLPDAYFRHDFMLSESDLSVYQVDDLDRLNIKHAHSLSSVSAIEEGQTVYVSQSEQSDVTGTTTIKTIFIE